MKSNFQKVALYYGTNFSQFTISLWWQMSVSGFFDSLVCKKYVDDFCSRKSSADGIADPVEKLLAYRQLLDDFPQNIFTTQTLSKKGIRVEMLSIAAYSITTSIPIGFLGGVGMAISIGFFLFLPIAKTLIEAKLKATPTFQSLRGVEQEVAKCYRDLLASDPNIFMKSDISQALKFPDLRKHFMDHAVAQVFQEMGKGRAEVPSSSRTIIQKSVTV